MGTLNTTIGYSHTNDLFTEIIDTTEGNRTFLTNDNIADQDNWSLSIGTPVPMAKWWESYLSITGLCHARSTPNSARRLSASMKPFSR
jgi:hypothetical protein